MLFRKNIRIERNKYFNGGHNGLTWIFETVGKDTTLGGNYSLSQDSCSLSFLELPSPRIKNGTVGTFYTLGLCNQKVTAKTVTKPGWILSEISNATIRPLDSLYYNPYNQNVPFIDPNYNAGKKTALHPKMIEGLLVFLMLRTLLALTVPVNFRPRITCILNLTLPTKGKKYPC